MKQYQELLKSINENGTWKKAARENMPRTKSLFGPQMRFNLQEGFPIVTTKKVSFRWILFELLWFLKGDTNIKFLVDRKCNIWNDDQKNFSNKNNWTEEGSLGYQYGWLWRTWGKEDRKWQPKPILNINLPLEKPSDCKKSKKVGKFVKSNKNLDVLVLDYLGKSMFKVQFQNTGTIINISSSNLTKGEMRDPYAPNEFNTCCGKDNGEMDQKIRRKLYVTWENMISRCYDKTHTSYKNYGGKGKYVDNRWLCFEYFAEDCVKLNGWENKIKDWESYHLDKDLIGRGYIYSKKDCVWLHKNDNLAKNERTTYFTFENKESGETYRTNNVSEFGRKFNLGKKFIKSYSSHLLKGKIESYEGWRLINTEDLSNKGVDQIKELIEGLKSNPEGRRHIVTSWNPSTLDDMALTACHALFQMNCRELTLEERVNRFLDNYTGDDVRFFDDEHAETVCNDNKIPQYYLDCHLYQRSADSMLGIPFNIASYALLTHIIAQICNFVVGDFIHTFGDCHIYENHLEAVEEQLQREPKPLPTLKIERKFENIDPVNDNMMYQYDKVGCDKFFGEILETYNFELLNYESHPKLTSETELSTGLKK